MKSLETLVLTTTLVMGCMSALAQNTDADSDPVHAGDIAPKPEIMPARNGVIRYSAGDSIPLGFSPPAQKPSVPESAQVPAIEVTRDRPGDSIPLALPAAQNTPGVENTPAQPAVPQTRLGRYTAGESIALSYPSASEADLRAAAAAQKSVPGYSGAANIPLAGALGDSLTTHIGISQAGLSEANGLINTSPAGLVGLFVLKAGIIYYLDQQKPQVRTEGLKAAAGVWSGFTMNNLLLIAGSTNPISLVGGALFGAYMYHREGISLEREASAKAAQELLAKNASAQAQKQLAADQAAAQQAVEWHAQAK